MPVAPCCSPKQYLEIFSETTIILPHPLSLSADDPSHFSEKADTSLPEPAAFFSWKRLSLHMGCFLLMVGNLSDSPVPLLSLSSLLYLVSSQSLPCWLFPSHLLLPAHTSHIWKTSFSSFSYVCLSLFPFPSPSFFKV